MYRLALYYRKDGESKTIVQYYDSFETLMRNVSVIECSPYYTKYTITKYLNK